MKNEVAEITLYDNKYDTKHNAKIIYSETDGILLKIYEKTSVIKRLRYIGENTNCDTDNVRYKQIISN